MGQSTWVLNWGGQKYLLPLATQLQLQSQWQLEVATAAVPQSPSQAPPQLGAVVSSPTYSPEKGPSHKATC